MCGEGLTLEALNPKGNRGYNETMDTLKKVLKDKINGLKYLDLVGQRPSGMTRLQEWFRQNGIKEVLEDEPWDENRHIRIKHPVAWTLASWHGGPRTVTSQNHMLLVPRDLALKIETLGFMP